MRCADEWLQVRLSKNGGVSGTEKDRLLVADREDDATLSKQSLKRKRPGDRQAACAAHDSGPIARPSRSAPPSPDLSRQVVEFDAIGDNLLDGWGAHRT